MRHVGRVLIDSQSQAAQKDGFFQVVTDLLRPVECESTIQGQREEIIRAVRRDDMSGNVDPGRVEPFPPESLRDCGVEAIGRHESVGELTEGNDATFRVSLLNHHLADEIIDVPARRAAIVGA